jgi:hypothetical protein
VWRGCVTRCCLRLLKQLEGALLGDVAGLAEAREGLEASGVLLLAYDATILCLHEVLLGQATGRVSRRAVPNLGRRSIRRELRATLLTHVLAILTRRTNVLAILTSIGHLSIFSAEKIFHHIAKRGTCPAWIF